MFSYINKIFKFIIGEIQIVVLWFVLSYPDSRFGKFVRKKYWSKKLKKHGYNLDIHMRSTIGKPELIEIGDNFMLSVNVHMTAFGSKGIFIGDNVGIGRGSCLHASNHVFDNVDIPTRLQGVRSKDISYKNTYYSIIIEDDVWLATRVIVLKGVTIGKGSVVGAGSVVTKSIPPNTFAVGNPAQVIMSIK